MTPYKASFGICKLSWLHTLIFLLTHYHQTASLHFGQVLFTTYYNGEILATTQFYNVFLTHEPSLLSAYSLAQEQSPQKPLTLPILKNLSKNFAPVGALFSNLSYQKLFTNQQQVSESFLFGGLHKPTTNFKSLSVSKNDMSFMVSFEQEILGFIPVSIDKKFSFSDHLTCSN
jgi:hypothetical protein